MDLSKRLELAGKALKGEIDDEKKPDAELVAENDRLREALAVAEKVATELRDEVKRRDAELAAWKRKASEYFDVVDSVLKQRDQWKKMWFDHGSEHLNAQAVMESAMTVLKQLVLGLRNMVNAYRAEKGEKPVTMPEVVVPENVAGLYAASLAKAREGAPIDIDGAKERDRIAAS